MKHNGVVIDETFAEAFPMKATRILITAHNIEWARHAAVAATGFATSVIACGCEAGVERDEPHAPPRDHVAEIVGVARVAEEARRQERGRQGLAGLAGGPFQKAQIIRRQRSSLRPAGWARAWRANRADRSPR